MSKWTVGHELQRIGAHAGEWTCSSRTSGLQSQEPSLNWSKPVAYEDDSHDHIITTRTPCSKSA